MSAPAWMLEFCSARDVEFGEELCRPIAVELNHARWVCASDGNFIVAIRSDAEAAAPSKAIHAGILRWIGPEPNALVRIADFRKLAPSEAFEIGPTTCKMNQLAKALPHLRGEAAHAYFGGRYDGMLLIGDGVRIFVPPVFPEDRPKTRFRPLFLLEDSVSSMDSAVAEREAGDAAAKDGRSACDARRTGRPLGVAVMP